MLSGIPQGSVLGPLLFIIYTNDLPEICNELVTNLYIYADDTKIYKHISNKTATELLQRNVKYVSTCADRWLLKLNVSKCKSVSYTLRGNIGTKHYQMSISVKF